MEDEFDSEAPAFIDMNSEDVVEVNVDDTDNVEPMDEETENDDENQGMDVDTDPKSAKPLPPDQSFYCINSHNDSVYAVSIDIATDNSQDGMYIQVASGGGDDKAFLTSLQRSTQQINDNEINVNSLNLSESTPTKTHKDTVSSVAFNTKALSGANQQKMLAVGSYDGSIQIWNLSSTNNELLTTLEGPTDIEWLSWHPKGGTVLLAGSTDGTVWMYHAPTSKCMQVFVGHEGDVTCGTFTNDGKFAVTASIDGTMRIWAPRTGLSRHVFRFDGESSGFEGDMNAAGSGESAITCMNCRSVQNSNGNASSLILCGSENGYAYVCHVGTKKVLAALRHGEEDHSNAPASNDGDDDEAFEKDFRSVEAVGFYNGPNHNDLHNWCATAGVNGLLKVWDLGNNGQCRQVCSHIVTNDDDVNENTDNNESGITSLQWHPTLPLIFTATTDGIVRLWDARTGHCLLTLTGGYSDIINDMDVYFDPNNDKNVIVATASDDGKIRLFQVDVDKALNATQ